MNNFKKIALAVFVLLLANNVYAYRIYFNKIICINPKLMQGGRNFNTITDVVELFQRDCNRPMEGNYLTTSLTLFWDNKKASELNYLSPNHLAGLTGSTGDSDNDKFYITYKDKAREGMVLPVRGGYKEMYGNCHWLPTAAEGNPAMAGGPSIRYYLWESNVVHSDLLLNYFSIDLPGKLNKGPQLVMMTSAPGSNSAGPRKNGVTASNDAAVYVIEYEVKP